MDAAYLEKTVSAALVEGLAAAAQHRPEDSVDFLGNFLLKWVDTQKARAQEAEDDQQAEADAKEAASKSAEDAKVAATAKAAADANAAKSEAAAKTLSSARVVDEGVFTSTLNYLQEATGATGAYVAVKAAGAEGEDADDEDGPKGSLSFIAACADHDFMVGKSVSQPSGATFPAWVRPAVEEEEEEEEDEDGEPKAKPPPPELQPVHIRNVLRSTAEFFRVPRIGAYLAVPFEYNSLTHDGAIPPPEEKEEEEKEAGEDEEGKEGGEAPKATGPPPIPAGIPKLTQAAICLDTMGQNRPFSDAEISLVKDWAARLVEALNKSEQAQYEVNYKKHQDDLAAEAAAAAAAAAADAAAGGDEADE